jgi:hypothetical protein
MSCVSIKSADLASIPAAALVNRRTGHLVDGHLRVELALSRGESSVAVSCVGLDADEEALVLASLDPLGAMATTDEAEWAELLAGLTVDEEELAAALVAAGTRGRRSGRLRTQRVMELVGARGLASKHRHHRW